MRRIKKNSLIAMLLLIIAALCIAVFGSESQYSIYAYLLIVALITIALFTAYDWNVIHPNILFWVFSMYTFGLGPVILIRRGISFNYNYFFIILGAMLCFAFGSILFISRSAPRVKPRPDNTVIHLNFSRITGLYILFGIAELSTLFYLIKNRDILILSSLEDSRISAASGNGLLYYGMQMSIVAITMLYDIYCETGKNQKPLVSKITLFCLTIIASVSLMVTGFRANVMTLFMCLVVMRAGKKKTSPLVIVIYGVLFISAVTVLGVARSLVSGNDASLFRALITSIYVGDINLNYVFNTFPRKVDFQYGYTYLINLIMLLPGPDPDFTLWLKEQVGISFSGGGLTPTIIGEFYINFGIVSIYPGLFLMGAFGNKIGKYFSGHRESFLAVFYTWQFTHSASGGIANVMVAVILFTIVYKAMILLPIKKRGVVYG